MEDFYLNNNAQSNGDHEVHRRNCSYFPQSNYEFLGQFSDCKDAVRVAIAKYPLKKINGCYYCSRSCHTT